MRAAALVFVDDPTAPVLDDDDVHHLVDVLRLRPAEAVVACDGEGTWTLCRFRGAPRGSSGSEVLEVDAEPVTEAKSRPPITNRSTATGIAIIASSRTARCPSFTDFVVK